MIVLLALGAAAPVAAQRLPDVLPGQYTEEQRQAAIEFAQARKMPVFGPFAFMMHSPELAKGGHPEGTG
ncbi:MAG TPA: hypothetical protein VHX52_13450 [Steroidobacteraceae bacterium]|nr:hypothetical protein [Steroidobacteraceae bacterium]